MLQYLFFGFMYTCASYTLYRIVKGIVKVCKNNPLQFVIVHLPSGRLPEGNHVFQIDQHTVIVEKSSVYSDLFIPEEDAGWQAVIDPGSSALPAAAADWIAARRFENGE